MNADPSLVSTRIPHPHDSLIVTAPLAPLYREPAPRSELISQLLAGETAEIHEARGEWYRILRDSDGYPGWIHQGYGRAVNSSQAEQWRQEAVGRALGARLDAGPAGQASLPLLARVAPDGAGWRLPSGARARLMEGRILDHEALRAEARAVRPLDWARTHFAGAPYLWGGISPWGVDCSGLVQSTYAARGVVMPRDSGDQACAGEPVAPDAWRPGDLLFFGATPERITHVAFAGDDETLVHSTIACGGFVVEPWTPGTRAARLRAELRAVRRIPMAP